jgi:hypothetical protein
LIVALGANLGSQQPAGKAATAPDGLMRSELSLVGRTASVAVTPDLRASDPAYESLFAAGGPRSGGRVRIGQFSTTGALTFGTVSVGKTNPAGVRYDLWLEGAPDGWQLEFIDSPPPTDAQTAAAPARIVLPRSQSAAATPTLIAAFLPASRETGRFVLRWGGFTAESAVQFMAPLDRRPPAPGRPNEPINRKHDEENRGARFLMLSQLNETALVLPKGSRLSIAFARSFPKEQRRLSAAGTNLRPGPGVDGPDFARLLSTANGAVVQLTEAPVPRMLTEVPLRFGSVVLRTGNQTAGYPGAYGVWLKRVGQGWRLVFNHEPDAWGTQHDPKFDAGEIEVVHSQGGDPSRPFAIALEPTATDRGRLLVHWGPHDWSADFVVGE